MKIGIVGAGITGLYLAWKLAEKGENVTIFEKKDKVGKEACSGLFSERILNFIPRSQSLIQNKINYCLIHFPKRTLKIKFSKEFLIINHSELDKLVANLATNLGVKIIFNKNISFLPDNFDRIIGCDGANSKIRKILGLKEPQFYLGIQNIILKEDNSNFVETWPTNSGFLWKIPRGKETEYGILEKQDLAKKLFDEFLTKNNIQSGKINSAIVSQGLIIPDSPKVTLCGESAGLTKPWSGGGVIWSLIASEILFKNFPNFVKYKKEMERFFFPKIIFSKMAKYLVYFLGFNFPWILPKNINIESDFLV